MLKSATRNLFDGNIAEPARQMAQAHGMEALAAFFLLFLVLDRFGGAWNVSSVYVLLSGAVLSFLLLKRPWSVWAPFLLGLLAVIAWMCFRDVVHGSGWAAGERMIKATILLLGLLACAELPLPSWRRGVGIASLAGLACFIGLVGWEQAWTALAAPLELAKAGFVTDINRNQLALPLGLLTVWAIAACIARPRGLMVLAALVLLGFTIANGSRAGVAGVIAAAMILLLFHAPRKAMVFGGLFAVIGGVTLLAFPEYWLHGGSVMNYRDVIWSAVLEHLPEQGWLGAGRGYFRAVISPEIAAFFPAGYVVPFAHNIYLDWLLAYGAVGVLLLLLAGYLLSRMRPENATSAQHAWWLATGVFLMTIGFFGREPHDPWMLLGLLTLPSLLVSLSKLLRPR